LHSNFFFSECNRGNCTETASALLPTRTLELELRPLPDAYARALAIVWRVRLNVMKEIE